MKRKIIILFVGLTLLSFANADRRLEDLEDTFSQISLSKNSNQDGIKFLSEKKNGMGAGFYIEPFIWKSQVDGTAVISEEEKFILNPCRNVDEVKELKFDWDFGFKIGSSKVLSYDNWNLECEYTYFKNRGTKNFKTAEPSGLNILDTKLKNIAAESILAFNGRYLVPGYVSTAFTNSKLFISRIDFVLAKSFYLSKKLKINTGIAIDALYLKIKQNTTFAGGNLLYSIGGESLYGLDFLGFEDAKIFLTQKNKVFGIGPKFKFKTNWKAVKNFSLYSEIYQSLLLGCLKKNYIGKFSGYLENYQNRSQIMHRILPTIGLELGCKYAYEFKRSKSQLVSILAYENQYFFNFLNLSKNNWVSSFGISGVNLKLGYYF